MAEDEKVEFTSFRPFEEKVSTSSATLLRPNTEKSSNIEINMRNTQIVFKKTPPLPKKQPAASQPSKIPRVDSWTRSADNNRASVSSISQVSAVGMTTGSVPTNIQQSHWSNVEEQLGVKVSSSKSSTANDRHWMPDKLCHQCSECEVKFSMFVRRHHCRICGRIFCNSCSNCWIPGHHLKPSVQGKVRCCSSCLTIFYEMHTSQSNTDNPNPPMPINIPPTRGRSNSISSDKGSPELESISALSFNPSMVTSRVSWDDGTDADAISSPSRANTMGIEFDNPTPLRQGPKRRMSKDDNILALTEDEIDVRLQEIWSKFTDKTLGLPPQTRRHRFGIRTFQNVYIAQEIVDWLIENKHAYSREMAIRIGQTFIDTKYLTVVSSPDQVFRDSKDIILEIDESGSLSPIATSPTIIDAPNWFLTEEGDDSTTFDPGNRFSVHEAKVDMESGHASFHRRSSSETYKMKMAAAHRQQLSESTGISPPVVLDLAGKDVIEEENTIQQSQSNDEKIEDKPAKEDGESDSFFVKNYFSNDDSATPTIEGCLYPPSLATRDSTHSLNPSMTSYSVLTPNSVIQAFPLVQNSHISSSGDSLPIQKEIKQQHIADRHVHLDKFLTQHLVYFGISLSWLEYIQPLILEASRKVRTHILPDDLMDVEAYCKVKKIPGGRKPSCCFIHGVVFSKHVSHKKMDLSIRNPRILMLKCAMEFQRRENQMSSFDTLMLQEQEYLKNLVDRVKSFQPDIILVQKSVARFALEMFHHHRIVVVVNVKPSVMSRVARSTQGDLLSNLDQLYFNVKLGTCGRFYVRTFTLPEGVRKTLMYFDDCEPKLGGVILLHGSDTQELKKVKKVVKFGLQVAHNMRLESAFLTDEFAVSSDRLTPKSELTDEYVTPPASPELFLYPFSDEIFDEKAQKKSDTGPFDDSVPQTPSIIVESMETMEQDKESMVEGDVSVIEGGAIDVGVATRTEAVCHIPTPVDQEPLTSSQEDDPTSEPIIESTDTKEEDSPSEPKSKREAKSSEAVFDKVLHNHLMSTSPHVQFQVPYLQTEQSTQTTLKVYLPNVVYWSYWFQPRASIYKYTSMDSVVHAAYLRKKSLLMLSDRSNPGEYGYKRVSSHPFVSSSFLHPASSNEMKSALADFRARVGHPDEPNCFFFPTAREATDMPAQLHKVFAKSRDFEEKAKKYHLVRKEVSPIDTGNDEPLQDDEGDTSDPQSGGLSKRTTRWTVPEKESHRTTTPVKKQQEQLIPPGNEPDLGFEVLLSDTGSTNNLAKVIEGDRLTPEPTVLIPGTVDNPQFQSDKETTVANTEEQIDCLDPFNHQSISLVFSSTCHDQTKRLYPCVPPCIIPMSYYGRNDIPFGEFLHRYCFREQYICQSCNVDMSAHQRHFIHGGKELRITMQQLGASIPGGDKNVFTWSTCTQCGKQSTPLVPLSEDSLYFSFAKFLELKFYATNYSCYNFNEEGLPPTCTHSIHSYAQFFSYHDKVATFELFPVNVFEVRIPPQEMQLDPLQVVHHNYMGEISHLSKLIESVFYHIKKYVEVYNLEPVQALTKNTMDRFLGMRETLRLKAKRLKDLSIETSVVRGENVGEEAKEAFCVLQDSIAELKQSLADTVDWFNKDLFEVDSKLRELMAKKDSSHRDTPHSATTDSSSPKQSPRIVHKLSDSSKGSKVSSGDEAIDSNSTVVKQHRRQYSDSSATDIRKLSGEHVGGVSKGAELKTRVGSDSHLPHPSEEGEDDWDYHLKSHHSSSSSLPFESCEKEEEGELVSAVRESMTSDAVMAVVYSTEDIMTKIRGKDIEDPGKFYYLRSTTITTSSGATEHTDSKGHSKRAPNSTSSSKAEDTENGSNSGGGIKAKLAADRLTSVLSKPFQKLPSPFETTEHHLLRGKLRFQISVYENEPTSIIAFALCSRDYARELKLLVEEARKVGLSESVVSFKSQTTPRSSEGDVQSAPTNGKTTGFIKTVFSEIRKKKPQTSTNNVVLPDDAPLESPSAYPYVDEHSGNQTNIQWSAAPDASDRFSSSHEQKHISLEFADDTTKFFCKVYYAEEFRKLRELLHLEGDDGYIRSLARCVRYEAKGGKSKSMFLKTFEDRLIMKQVQMVEITSFIEIAPEYFKHITDGIKEKKPVVLAKILGAYSIGFKNTKTGRSNRLNVIIMENLLYRHKCSKVFDLKGSMRGRYVTQDPKKDGKGDVLMDENFLEFVYDNPVYVRPHAKAVLMQAIIADTLFLSKNSIMDYSLLTGLDEESGELVVGIIDFVRPFTLDKRLEMIFKKTGRSVLPTVVYPDLYQKRFIDAMDRYFSPIPDKWTGLGADIRVSY